MNFKKIKLYDNQLVENNRDSLFIFGDNLDRVGSAGQAIIRNNTNVLGIATKKHPDMNEESFYSDNLECLEYLINDLHRFINVLNNSNYKEVILPEDGLGTGLAQLNKKAPKLFEFMNNTIELINELSKNQKEYSHKIEIYTDGSCQPQNPNKPGAASALILINGIISFENAKTFYNTTNNQMELLSAIIALKELERLDLLNEDITLYSDSQYLINGMNEYLDKWIANNYNGIKNPEYWKILSNFKKSNIKYIWVKGHNNNVYNEIVNKMAQTCMKGLVE